MVCPPHRLDLVDFQDSYGLSTFWVGLSRFSSYLLGFLIRSLKDVNFKSLLGFLDPSIKGHRCAYTFAHSVVE